MYRYIQSLNQITIVVYSKRLSKYNILFVPIDILLGNFCDVTEKWWGQAVDSCKCPDLSGPENPDCQLQFDEVEKTIMCRKNPSHSCRVAIEAWATAYKNAPNANDICCKYGDPNYNGSQTAWNSCSSGNN